MQNKIINVFIITFNQFNAPLSLSLSFYVCKYCMLYIYTFCCQPVKFVFSEVADYISYFLSFDNSSDPPYKECNWL